MISHHHSNNTSRSASNSNLSINEFTNELTLSSKSNSEDSLDKEKLKKHLQKKKSSSSQKTTNSQASVTTKNLWQLCKIEKEKEKKDNNKVELNDIGIESSIFIAGSPEGGKSTLISSIFDKNTSNISSSTLLLDYT
jgi:dynein light intermediate chain 2